MKKVIAKQGLMSLLAGFFLFSFLMLTASRAAAQDANWMQTDQAKQVLATAVNDLHTAIPNLQGTQKEDAYRHVSYYKAIFAKVDEGVPTHEAAVSALSIFDAVGASGAVFARSEPPSEVTGPVTKAMLDALYKDAEDLLTL